MQKAQWYFLFLCLFFLFFFFLLLLCWARGCVSLCLCVYLSVCLSNMSVDMLTPSWHHHALQPHENLSTWLPTIELDSIKFRKVRGKDQDKLRIVISIPIGRYFGRHLQRAQLQDLENFILWQNTPQLHKTSLTWPTTPKKIHSNNCSKVKVRKNNYEYQQERRRYVRYTECTSSCH